MMIGGLLFAQLGVSEAEPDAICYVYLRTTQTRFRFSILGTWPALLALMEHTRSSSLGTQSTYALLMHSCLWMYTVGSFVSCLTALYSGNKHFWPNTLSCCCICYICCQSHPRCGYCGKCICFDCEGTPIDPKYCMLHN